MTQNLAMQHFVLEFDPKIKSICPTEVAYVPSRQCETGHMLSLVWDIRPELHVCSFKIVKHELILDIDVLILIA